MRIFNIDNSNLIVKVDNKGLKVEEVNKIKGKLSLWSLTYKHNEFEDKYMFKLEYRWQTTPMWYNTFDEAKQFLEEQIKFSLSKDAIELYISIVLSKKMENN